MAKTVEQARAELAEAEAREAAQREEREAAERKTAQKAARVSEIRKQQDSERAGIAHLREKIALRESNIARLEKEAQEAEGAE